MEQNREIINPTPRGGSHCHTKFSEVARIVKIDSENIPLPPNMAFAEGKTRMEKHQFGVDLLHRNPSINAVIALCGNRKGTDVALSELYAAASGKRLKLSRESTQTPNTIKDRLRSYREMGLAARGENRGTNPLSSNDNFSATASLWEGLIDDSRSLETTHLVKSTITYMPKTAHGTEGEIYINAHIDGVHYFQFDIRIVEIQEGSGTLLFDDNDFEINGSRLHKVGDLITCWELSVGSSVIMRCPSERAMRNGGRPCVHAHGIGQFDGAEQRLVSKCDLKIF